MSIQRPSGQETDAQIPLDSFTGQQSQPSFSIGHVDDSGRENGVDRRVKRALTECFHVQPTSSTEYLIESGSGARYFIDLYDPDQPVCSCEDDACYCKHVWHIFLFTNPEYLTERIYGMGTGR